MPSGLIGVTLSEDILNTPIYSFPLTQSVERFGVLYEETVFSPWHISVSVSEDNANSSPIRVLEFKAR